MEKKSRIPWDDLERIFNALTINQLKAIEYELRMLIKRLGEQE